MILHLVCGMPGAGKTIFAKLQEISSQIEHPTKEEAALFDWSNVSMG
jgi:broad-specificity NMP kinase